MSHAPDLTGHALDDRYELHELIGEGTFGRVYRGLDRRLARAVAVKVIKPWWSDDPTWVRSLEREAQLLARVNDPGIVQIFDVGQAAEGMYYVAELVQGGSLAQRLRLGPIPAWEACELAIQLCSALAQAHGHGLVHRDVKPANVLISAHGRIKVGDFGVALLAEGSSDGAVTVVGTPRYMAPEQARGRLPTPATDIYSAGVVMYEMFSGHAPFTGQSSVELALKHIQEPPPPLPSEVPRTLQRIVLRAMAKRPEERYQDAGAMGEALLDAVRTEGSASATPVRTLRGEPRRVSQKSRRQLSVQRAQPGRARGDDTASTLHAEADRRRPSVARRSGRGGFDEPHRPAATQVAPRRTPRRNVNPAARRRTAALFSLVLLILAGMGAGAALLSRPSKAAPPPVKVPRLRGESSGNARMVLRSLGLRVRSVAVPAPGLEPGTVTRQVPAAGAELPPGARVKLYLAEVPRWRPVASLHGNTLGQTVPFRVRGRRWRIVYTMDYLGTCTFIFICSGPTAHVTQLGGEARGSQFDLAQGQNEIQSLSSGAGTYQVTVSPGNDTASWAMKIEDYY